MMDDFADSVLAIELAARGRTESVIFAAHSEAQAGRVAAAARVLASAASLALLPGWDCLPFDRVSPSHAVMGQRMAALRRLAGRGPHLLVASVAALAQRLPPFDPESWLTLEAGQAVDPVTLAAELRRLGYVGEAPASVPGEVAVEGEVIDVFPAAGAWPVRLRLTGQGRLGGIDRFDPATQRSRERLDRLEIGPASELLPPEGQDRTPGLEHRLAEFHLGLCSAFDLLPGATLLLDPESEARMQAWLAQLAEARATRIALTRAAGGKLPADGLYLDADGWLAARANGQVIEPPDHAALPAFQSARDPLAAGMAYVTEQSRAGVRVGISGRRLARALRLSGRAETNFTDLQRALPGTTAALPAGLAAGFATDQAAAVADSDIWPRHAAASDPAALFAQPMRPGDAVIHLDHGVARLESIKTLPAPAAADALALGFAGGTRKLVPCLELDRIWRYGADAQAISLDRADGSTWHRRCRGVEASMDATARGLIAQAEARQATRAPKLQPPAREMRRFVAGFAYAPTADQQVAFAAIAADLARGWPMDRLVCGDVGFGKTEVALRAAAAAALSGRQVAVLAPTTVLVRQHAAVFAQRFAAVGVEVAALSRLTPTTEARRIRARLASGELRVVIGTTALAGGAIAFADLALVVIDEEQRFGTRHKAALARLRDGVHVLTMTATPIPRTLLGALAGLHEVSVLATPPAARLPVRTTVQAQDPSVLAAALTREHARGGQSFVVSPRIADLAPLAERLHRLAPGLTVTTLHGRLPAAELDAAIVGFAAGEGDVLLSTDIVEAGLDIPRANTMMVLDADRLGIAQLHQLRGRVGRGRARGSVYLFTDPGRPPTATAAQRLAALAAHDGLGAGFAVAAADLDLRGAGDLLGEDQAGHVKLLGVDLARHLLAQALARARGETREPDVEPELVLDLPAWIPADYIADPAARIELHRRLCRPHDGAALAEEIADRFGPPPEPFEHLLALAELRSACRRLRVRRLEAGPEAIAAELAVPAAVAGLELRHGRLLLRRKSATAAQRLAAAWELLHTLSDPGQHARAA